MSERPTPLTDEATRAAGGQWTFLARDLSRNLERQLAAATNEREQMGKQAHANACEAMEYRRQRDAYAETLRQTLILLDTTQSIERSVVLAEIIRERHPELAENTPTLPPTVGSGDGSHTP